MSNPIKVTVHEDATGDWVLRLVQESKTGARQYVSLGMLNGQQEAELVRDILQGAIELHYQVADYEKLPPGGKPAYALGERNADRLVEGENLIKYAGSLFGSVAKES